MKLYEFGPTRSIRARWILQELGVDFDAVSVDLTRREHCSPDFLELPTLPAKCRCSSTATSS
jgi:glutathione S-transferase